MRFKTLTFLAKLRHVRIDIVVPEIDEEVIDPGGHVGASCQLLLFFLGAMMQLIQMASGPRATW